MNEREKLRSESLNLLRFPLAICVLTIHVFNSGDFVFQGRLFLVDSTPLFREFNYIIDGVIRGKSVPIYYFISGYVFFYGIILTKEKYFQKIKNRIKTLFIPYIIWNTAAILFGLFRHLPFLHKFFPHIDNTNLSFSLSSILYSYWDRNYGIFSITKNDPNYIPTTCWPENIPLWFLRDLMIVVLTTPILYWIIKHTRHYFICFMGVLWFFSSFLDISHHLKTIIVAYFFFSFGAYMSINKKDMLIEFGKYFRLSIYLFLGLSILYVVFKHIWPEANNVVFKINIFVGLIFAYNMATWLLKKQICKPNKFLSSASFFIYITHFIVCEPVLKLHYLLFNPTTDLLKFFVYISTVLTTTGGLLITFWLLREYAPKVLKVIAGRK